MTSEDYGLVQRYSAVVASLHLLEESHRYVPVTEKKRSHELLRALRAERDDLDGRIRVQE